MLIKWIDSQRARRILGLLALTVVATACGPVYVQRDDAYYQETRATASYSATAGGQQWSYLDAHGYWTNTARLGRVWVAAANRDPNWRPYYYGHWDHTDYGWTWVSDEAWGWGPYHYGRWTWHDRHHWVWIPGYTWGPAWVTWRSGGGCVGWAPMGPSGVNSSHHTFWVFVPQGSIYRTRVATAVIRPGRAQVIYNQSVNVGGSQRIRDHRGGVTTYNRGPSVSVANGWTNNRVRTTSVTKIPSAVPRAIPTGRAPANTGRRPTYTPNARTSNGVATRPAPTFSGARVSPTPARPGYRAPTAPGYRTGPGAGGPTRAAPVYRAPSYRTPAYRPPSRQAPQPTSRTGRPGTRAAPVYQAPTRRAPTYTAPTRRAPTYTAPTRSAPSYGRSAPRADSRSTPYRVTPRSSSSSSSKKRPVTRTRAAPSRSRPSRRDR